MLDLIKEWWWPILPIMLYIYIKTKLYFYNGQSNHQKSSIKKVEVARAMPKGHVVAAVINRPNFDKLNKHKDKNLVINSALEEYFKNQES